VHNLAVVAFTIPTQGQSPEPTPVKTLALLTMPDGPKVLSGSTDGVVKVSVVVILYGGALPYFAFAALDVHLRSGI
jgi:hypothetical protein